jgi:hypothetical protein
MLPVEFALNSEVAQAPQIIPRLGIFMGRTHEHYQSWVGTLFIIEGCKRHTILIARVRVAYLCASLLKLHLTQFND